MATQIQIAANRQNALKSTGPTTEQGKAVVCRNARKHGILSQKIPLGEEEEKLFGEFCESFYAQWDPKGEFEHFLVDRIASSAWRLRRLIEVETDFFGKESKSSFSMKSNRAMKEVFSGYAKDGIAVLSRYETALEKGLYRAIAELMKLQAMRQGICLIANSFADNRGDENGFVSQNSGELEIDGNSLDRPV